MSKDAFGFSGKKKLDLSGIPAAAPDVSPEREAAAIQRGEELGFVPREAGSAGPVVIEADLPRPGEGGKVVRSRPGGRARQRTVYIKGPEEVLDEFVAFVNERGYSAYWEAIRDLMAERSR